MCSSFINKNGLSSTGSSLLNLLLGIDLTKHLGLTALDELLQLALVLVNAPQPPL